MQNVVIENGSIGGWRKLRSLLAVLCLLAVSSVGTRAQNSVNLAWDPNSESDLAGYIVRYGVASGHYTNSTTVGKTTTAVISGLVSGVTYYFVVVAYNTSNLQSDPSNEVTTSFTPPPPSSNTPPTLSAIADRTINEDTTSPAISFTVGDAETPAASLGVSFASSNPSLIPNNNITLGGSGSSRTVTIRPATDQTGLATITLVVSDGFLTTNRWFDVTVNPVNDAPTLTSIANLTINENGVSPAIPFTIADAETAAGSLTVSASSANRALVPDNRITLGGSGSNRTVVVQPAADQSGIATITLTVSDGSLTATRSFVITVDSVNTAPTIGTIANQTINEDATTAAIGFVISDAETSPGSLTLSGNSSNPSLVPINRITFGGSGGNRSVTVQPAANQSGTANITLTVSDGIATASKTFSLRVDPVNDAPTLTSIANLTINENGVSPAIPFTIADAETAAGSLTVSASSANRALVPDNRITLGGSGSNRTVVVRPAADQSGIATITLTVSDGSLTATRSFVITVDSVNTAPTIGTIANQTINEDATTAAIGFVISDAETSPGSLTLSGNSSNPSLVPINRITFGGSGGNRSVTVQPAANQSGTANITLTVSDGIATASKTFSLRVDPVNDAPTLTSIANLTINENGVSPAIPFTIADAETAAGSLTVSASSANRALVPDNRITLGGSGSNRTVVVRPAADQSGIATITLTVSDGSLTATRSFVITVDSVNTAPTIGTIANQTINEDATTAAIGFVISDAETSPGSLTLSGNSSNPSLVPINRITFGGSGGNRSVTVQPAANQSGTANITVIVSDGIATASKIFSVRVNPVNDAPTITGIANQTVIRDMTSAPISFTISDLETSAGSLTLTATSSDSALLPKSRIVFGGSGSARTVRLSPATNQLGTATVTITVSDGTLTTSVTFVVTVEGTNHPPIITSPTAIIVDKNSPQVLSGITVADADAGESNITVRLSVNFGTMTIDPAVPGGLTADRITSNGSGTITLFGSVLSINRTLRAQTGCVYLSEADFVGADTLTIYANDHGNTGGSGPQTDMRTCLLSVTGSGFENWQSQTFDPEMLADTNSESAVWGDKADPDGDGRENLLEFALGSDPYYGEAAVEGLATGITEINGKSYLTISFNRRRSDTTVNYVVETSTDGVRWRSGSACVRDLGTVEIDPEFERVTCRDAVPLSALRPRFIRLKVIKMEL